MGPRPIRRRRPGARAFQVGKVFGTSLTLWARNVVVCVLGVAVVFAPYGFYLWRQAAAGVNVLQDDPVGNLLAAALHMLATAPIIGVVFSRMRGDRVSIPRALLSGLARVPAAAVVAVLVGLVVGVLRLLPWGVALLLPGGGELLALPLLVPMAIVQCGLYVAIPVAVVERPGPMAALRRSWYLTRGHKGGIFLVFLVFMLAMVVAMAVVFGSVAVASEGELDPSWEWLFAIIVLITSIEAVFATVIYHDLRLAKDGVDPAEVAAVFD